MFYVWYRLPGQQLWRHDVRTSRRRATLCATLHHIAGHTHIQITQGSDTD